MSSTVKTVCLVIIVVILIAILLYFVYQKLKRNKPPQETPNPEPKQPAGPTQSYNDQSVPPRSELLNKLQQLQSIKEADNESEELLQDDSDKESEKESEKESDNELNEASD